MGLTLIKTEQPLKDALKIWLPLEKMAGRRVETWLAGYEIRVREGECCDVASAFMPLNERDNGG